MIQKYIFLVLFFSFLGVHSQQTQLSVADKKYANYKYIDAIKIYEKVVEKGYKSAELYQKIANSYYFNSDFKNANTYYSKLLALTDSVQPEIYFRYSQTLKTIGNQKKSTEYLNKYDEITHQLKNPSETTNATEFKEKFKIDTVSFNSEFYDFTPAFYKEQVVFASSRVEKNSAAKIHDWTNQNFTDLFIATTSENEDFRTIENFSLEINSKFNESSAVFTNDGKKMYFTRNNFLKGKKGKDENRSTLIKIYSAEFINEKWTNIKELPFNKDGYSCAHPALNPDNSYLYFASDLPGTHGGADIFRVQIQKKGKYGKPENLGKTINTENRESYPFIDAYNTLFFATDARAGLGGLDIFASEFTNGVFQNPVNIGKPINSPFDDFALILDAKRNGYFTSNRSGGKGFDDIYKITTCISKLEGIITDFQTNELLENVTVLLFDENGNELEQIKTNATGNYQFNALACDKKYLIRTLINEYETAEIMLPITAGLNVAQNIAIQRTVFPFEKGTDLAKIFNISIIYFDLDKWNIRLDAAQDIQKVIEVMLEYPTITVGIYSHTDSRETHAYNEILSNKRAKSTLEFMVKSGIDRNRLTAKGFGENKLVNECADGVFCSEENHQLNRRSEFIVLE